MIINALSKILLLLACLSSMAYSQPTSQKTLYGFTAFPYDSTLEAIDKVNEFVLENSSLYAIHRDDGCIPWQETLSGKAFPEWLTDDWASIKARVPAELPISLHLTPTQSDRYTLAEQCGDAEGEVGAMPEVLRDKPYNDPQIMAAYLNYARRMADTFEPTFLTIGIEMSELSLNHPNEWEPFARLMTSTLEGLRESHPNLQLSVEFVLQSLMLPRVSEQVKPLVEQLDFLGISFYPYGSGFGEFQGAPALPEPPAQWLEPLEWLRSYTNKPIAIVETGYASKPGRAFGINFSGDEVLQEAFLKDLIQIAKEDQYLFVVWFVPVDYESLLEKLPDSNNADAAKIWVNAGLLDSDLNPKPAWKIWQSFAASPASSLPLLEEGRHLGTTFYSSGRVPDEVTSSIVDEAVNAGMNAFHFNEDWRILEVASGVYNFAELEATLKWLHSKGLVPYLNINIVDIDHLNLPAEYLDEAGNLVAGVRFNDPAFIKRFNSLLDEVVPLLLEHGGFYLGVGNEVDTRFSEHLAEANDYLEFVEAVRKHVHELEPRLAVGVTLTGNAVLENSAIFSQLQRVSDIVPFNYYPTDDTLRVKDFSRIPDDFKTLVAAYGDSPIIIQELGCSSAEVMNSSLEKQQRCFETMFAALAAYPQIRFISVFAFQDLDETTCDALVSYINLEQLAAEGLPAQFLERFRAFLCTLGLRNADGSAKPAWQSFLNELKRIDKHELVVENSSLPLLPAGRHLGTTFFSSGRVPEDEVISSAVDEAVHAGMNAFHFNEDWQDLEVAPGVYNLAELETTLSWLQSKGLVPYLNITLVDIDQLNLPAEYLDEAGNPLDGVRFDDPAFIRRFNQLLEEVVPLLVAHGGFYLGVGNEVDERFSEHPEELSDYLEFVEAVREHVHELEPRLAVGVTVTGNAVLENVAIVSQLKTVSDIVPFNYYPLDDTFSLKDFSFIPHDVQTLMAAYGDNPVIIQELGCPSAEVMGSSPAKQQQCFETLFAALAAYPQVRFISVFTFQDFDQETCDVMNAHFDELLEGLPRWFLERFRAYTCTLGLRHANGSAKPAWQAFLNELGRQ